MELRTVGMSELTTTNEDNMVKTVYKYTLGNKAGDVKVTISSDEHIEWLLPKSVIKIEPVETQTTLTSIKE